MRENKRSHKRDISRASLQAQVTEVPRVPETSPHSHFRFTKQEHYTMEIGFFMKKKIPLREFRVGFLRLAPQVNLRRICTAVNKSSCRDSVARFPLTRTIQRAYTRTLLQYTIISIPSLYMYTRST